MPPLSSIRPSLRATRALGAALLPKFHVPMSAYVVDCAVYVDGVRLARPVHPRPRHRRGTPPRRGVRLDRPARADRRADHGHRRGLRPARAGRRGRGARPPAAQARALRRHAVHGAQDRPLRRGEPTTASEVVETGEVMVFVGRDFVVTVRHGDHSGLRDVRQRLEADPEQLALGPAAVLHAIADQIVDGYVAVTDAIEDDIDEIEAEVFAPRSAPDAEQIYVMKREVLELRRAVVPLGGPAAQADRGLQRAGAARGALVLPRRRRPPGDRHRAGRRLRRAAHHARQRRAGEDHDAAERRHAQDHASWAPIVSVPTMIAGIYGMNFDNMPELHWSYGYPLTLMGRHRAGLPGPVPDLPPQPVAVVPGHPVDRPNRRRRRPGIACPGERAPADRARCGGVPVRHPRRTLPRSRTSRARAESAAPPAPARVGRSGTHLGRREARADPRRPEPGSGPTVRGLVRARRQPGGPAGPRVRPSGRRARGGGVALGRRHAARRPRRLPASGRGAVRRPGGRQRARLPLARHALGPEGRRGWRTYATLRRRRARLGAARRGRADPDGGPRARPAPARRRSRWPPSPP